ncbi:MAG: sigma-70 family polymerase sigma factor [Herbinix sp.]|jgi:RNA polymerase sigma-70 factor (ECF subfamily)|nr:sigma-70 family polymerase sigma factor [Herbinix sp.]
MNQNDWAEYLVETYADTILRLSYTYLKNTADAQDVCQTVFVKLLTVPVNFNSHEHEKAWILRTTANVCKNLLKSPWHRRICDLEACAEQPTPDIEDGYVLEIVNTLPSHYRIVIYLYYYEGYKANEIGEILGVPIGTVHTRLARGRAKLKRLLGGTEYGEFV